MEELYYNKKKLYLLRAKKLRELFNEFYLKTVSFGPKGMELHQIAQNDSKLLADFMDMCETNEDLIFTIRLMNSIMYVQDPTNQEVVQTLMDDIALNSNDKGFGSK